MSLDGLRALSRGMDGLRGGPAAGGLIQLYAFSQASLPSAPAQWLQSSGIPVSNTGTTLVQGAVLAAEGVGFAHDNTASTGGSPSTQLRNNDLDTDVLYLTRRHSPTGANSTTHTHTDTIPGGDPVLMWGTHDSAGNIVAGVNEAGTPATMTATHATGTPADPANLGAADATSGISYDGMQWAVFDAVIADPDESASQPLGKTYDGHADLISCPIPEAGLRVGTEVGTAVWRDLKAVAANRSTVALPSDGGIVGQPWGDPTVARTRGLEGFSTSDYATLGAERLLTSDSSWDWTIAIKFKTGSDIATRQVLLSNEDGAGVNTEVWVETARVKWRIRLATGSITNEITGLAATTTYKVIIAARDVDASNREVAVYVYLSGTTTLVGSKTDIVAKTNTYDMVGHDWRAGQSYNGGTPSDPWIGDRIDWVGFAAAAGLSSSQAQDLGSDAVSAADLLDFYCGPPRTGVVDLADAARLWYAAGSGSPVTVAAARVAL